MSATPSRLLNGYSPLQATVSAQERGKLVASISSSHQRKTANGHPGNRPTDEDDFDTKADDARRAYTDHDGSALRSLPSAHLREEEARDPRDEIVTAVIGRPASPYTLNPPIDFDGLSWPSESTEGAVVYPRAKEDE